MTPEAIVLRERAVLLALNAGYNVVSPEHGDLKARPGRFQGEPWSLPYFHDRTLQGDGEPFGDGEQTECDVLDVDDVEREAFDLKADTAAVAVTYSNSGFVGLVELTAGERDDLIASYDADIDEEDCEND